MYTFYCRAFQKVMKVGNYFMPYRMPDYDEGVNSIEKLPQKLIDKKSDNVLFVTDNMILQLGLADKLFLIMEQKGIKYTVFSDIEPNPTSENVEKGFQIFRQEGCNGIVAFGGGAPMDCAKAIGAKAAHPHKNVAQLQGLLKVHKKIPPLFAVPTTAGTGSETTVAAVITDSLTHHKASINDTALIPCYAVLDPLLTVGLPPFVTAITGMDALCHAVEAYTNGTYNTRTENEMAKTAVKLIYDNILDAYNDGKNIAARQNMQKAALFAGRAFTRGCVGYVHAVGHTLGGLYGVAHGLAMAVILPKVMKQFGSCVHKKLADLADGCGIEGDTAQQKAEGFIKWIEQTNRAMGIPDGFDMIQEKDIPQMIKWAKAEANPLYPVPQIWKDDDFAQLINNLKK